MMKEHLTLKEKIRAKIPGVDTGILLKKSFCDVCSPSPSCGVNCYMKDGKLLKVEGIPGHPAGNGVLCTKGLAMRQYIYRKDRLTAPLKRVGARGEGRFVPVSWDEALDETAERLTAVKNKYGASSAAFFSGYNKWYRPFLQRLCYSFGSVNYGSESSTCFFSTVMAWKSMTGGEMAAPDRKNAGTFLGWGFNPYYSRNMGPAPEGGRKGKEKVIIIDPRETPAVRLEADLFLQIRPGTDGALAHALARELILNDKIDHDYIKKNVYGFEEYRAYVMDFTPEKAETITGVPAEKIREAAAIIGENPPLAISHSSSTIVHHKNGFQNQRAIYALSAITGSFDRKGGNIPDPNTYAHTMVGFSTNVERFELEKYPGDGPKRVGAEKYPLWNELIPDMQANALADQILSGEPYPIRAVMALGMNYRMFQADRRLEKALKQLDFFVDADLFMTDTAKMADIVLPCASSLERSELKVYPGPAAWYMHPVIEPVGDVRSDTDIIIELAKRLEVEDELLRSGYDACMKYIFEGTGLDVDRIKAAEGELVPLNGIKTVQPGEFVFKTDSGKFELYSTVVEKYEGLCPLPEYSDGSCEADPEEYPLQLVAGGRLPSTMHSRLNDVPWLRSLRPQPMADIHPEDLEKLGIAAGDRIRIRTTEGEITAAANPSSSVKKGLVFMTNGYPEADVNSIVPHGHNDPYSGYPGFRNVRCRVEKL